MIKTARQLKSLIRNLSREKSADAQILMRNCMMERFLEQLHGTTLNQKILQDALMATAHKRGSEQYLNQAEEVFDEVENNS